MQASAKTSCWSPPKWENMKTLPVHRGISARNLVSVKSLGTRCASVWIFFAMKATLGNIANIALVMAHCWFTRKKVRRIFPLSTFHVRSFPMAQLRQRLSPNKTFWRGVLVRSGSSTSWRCRVDRAFFWDGRCLMMSAPQWRWENSTEIPSKTGEVPVSLSFWARYIFHIC